MTELFADIETLQDVLIAWEEGASDEKRMARAQLRKMLVRKEREVKVFEDQMRETEEEFLIDEL
jgi:ElaB/YqjD/DUF883 family membrane-anchored ribosome-binding protein